MLIDEDFALKMQPLQSIPDQALQHREHSCKATDSSLTRVMKTPKACKETLTLTQDYIDNGNNIFLTDIQYW